MALFMLLAAAAALGCVALVVLARGGSLVPPPSARPRSHLWGRRARQAGLAAAIGLGVLLVTRWPTMSLAAAAMAYLWPRIMGGGRVGRQQLAKIEAIAAWTESMRDTSAASSGLEQAIGATVSAAPQLLQRPLRDLDARVNGGRVPLPEALGRFADDVNDPAADMVVAALSLNARQRGGGLERILSELAATSRTELEMRRKIEHQRRAIRRQSTQITVATLGFATLQALFARDHVEPYSTVVGQIVLVVVVVLYVGAFMRMRALSEPEIPDRFLTAVEEITEIASYKPRAVTR